MKAQGILSITAMATLAMTCAIQTCMAQASSMGADQKIVGIWRCEMHNLPAVTLTITDEVGSLTGAALFYLHKSGPGIPETATPGVPEPLFHPSFDGTSLTFEVSHQRAHPPQTLQDPPERFALKLDGSGRAELVDLSEPDPKRPRYFFEKSSN